MSHSAPSTVTIALQDGMRFEATNSAGATSIMDTRPPEGGNAGLSPMEHLLAGLGGCTAMDVIGILRKKRLEVTDYRLEVSGVRAPEHPRVYTDITIRHIITGRNIPDEAVRHAIELSEEKYCSASAMLRQVANITTTFEVRSPEAVTTAT